MEVVPFALPFYTTVQNLKTKPDVLAKFLRATGKGWAYAQDNREKAVDFLVKEFPNLNKKDELEAIDVMLKYAFSANTKQNGWGAMDPAIWQEQIDLHAELKQFSKRVPRVDEVMTLEVLKATEAGRPKIG